MTYRKRKIVVQLIVNFNEIQHYTWLGTFWNCVYKYTYTCKFTKKLLYTLQRNCISPSRSWPSSSINQVLSTVISVQLLHAIIHLWCAWFLPDFHQINNRFVLSLSWFISFLPDYIWFLPDFLPYLCLISTRFLTIFTVDFYQI